ncbi:MAG: hypothetical protein ACKN9A_16395 [Microcystis aeruginosa]
MAKLLTISDWQSGNLVLKKTGFTENQLAESILFIWFYDNLVLQKTFLPDTILSISLPSKWVQTLTCRRMKRRNFLKINIPFAWFYRKLILRKTRSIRMKP